MNKRNRKYLAIEAILERYGPDEIRLGFINRDESLCRDLREIGYWAHDGWQDDTRAEWYGFEAALGIDPSAMKRHPDDSQNAIQSLQNARK